MAQKIMDAYDLSGGDTSVDASCMMNSRNQVVTFAGENFDDVDATLAWNFSVDDGATWHPVKDNNGNDVVVTLTPTGGDVTGYFNHEHFPGEKMQLVLTVNAVTAGTLTAILGGRTKTAR